MNNYTFMYNYSKNFLYIYIWGVHIYCTLPFFTIFPIKTATQNNLQSFCKLFPFSTLVVGVLKPGRSVYNNV